MNVLLPESQGSQIPSRSSCHRLGQLLGRECNRHEPTLFSPQESRIPISQVIRQNIDQGILVIKTYSIKVIGCSEVNFLVTSRRHQLEVRGLGLFPRFSAGELELMCFLDHFTVNERHDLQLLFRFQQSENISVRYVERTSGGWEGPFIPES